MSIKKIYNYTRSLTTKIIICLIWTGIIAGFLFLPKTNWWPEPKVLNVLAWSGSFVRAYIKKFEKETGIKVNISFYGSNEELLVKMRSTKGRGYDLIVPSDYAVKMLHEEGLLKKIDKSRLEFWDTLNPLLLGHYFDPHNDYSFPFEWEIYVLGLDTTAVPKKYAETKGWDLLYQKQPIDNYRVVMVNDPIEAVVFTTHYLFGPMNNLSVSQTNHVLQALKSQKQWVEAYANVRADYLLGTHNACVAVSQSSEVWRAIQDYPHVDFIEPEYTFITIENCAIPVASKKDDLIYKFVNFFYTKEAYEYNFYKQYFCPARLDVIDTLQVSDRLKKIMKSSPELFERYHFITPILPENERYDLWIDLKS